jgi:hypothetical protein
MFRRMYIIIRELPLFVPLGYIKIYIVCDMSRVFTIIGYNLILMFYYLYSTECKEF